MSGGTPNKRQSRARKSSVLIGTLHRQSVGAPLGATENGAGSNALHPDSNITVEALEALLSLAQGREVRGLALEAVHFYLRCYNFVSIARANVMRRASVLHPLAAPSAVGADLELCLLHLAFRAAKALGALNLALHTAKTGGRLNRRREAEKWLTKAIGDGQSLLSLAEHRFADTSQVNPPHVPESERKEHSVVSMNPQLAVPPFPLLCRLQCDVLRTLAILYTEKALTLEEISTERGRLSANAQNLFESIRDIYSKLEHTDAPPTAEEQVDIQRLTGKSFMIGHTDFTRAQQHLVRCLQIMKAAHMMTDPVDQLLSYIPTREVHMRNVKAILKIQCAVRRFAAKKKLNGEKARRRVAGAIVILSVALCALEAVVLPVPSDLLGFLGSVGLLRLHPQFVKGGVRSLSELSLLEESAFPRLGVRFTLAHELKFKAVAWMASQSKSPQKSYAPPAVPADTSRLTPSAIKLRNV